MKKMNNKGFSMVELIIVIAIMAILAGALAPTLIKYVNKSRMSSDVTTASTIATACSSGLADIKAEDDSKNYYGQTYDITTLASNGDSFKSVVFEALGGKVPSVKYKKNGATTFVVKFGGSTGSADVNVTVYASKSGTSLGTVGTDSWELSPNTDVSYE